MCVCVRECTRARDCARSCMRVCLCVVHMACRYGLAPCVGVTPDSGFPTFLDEPAGCPCPMPFDVNAVMQCARTAFLACTRTRTPTHTHQRTCPHTPPRGKRRTPIQASTHTPALRAQSSRVTRARTHARAHTRVASKVRAALQVPSDFGLCARVLPLRRRRQTGRARGAAPRAPPCSQAAKWE